MIKDSQNTHANQNPIIVMISQQRIPSRIVALLFYVCLCAGSWYATRQEIMYLADAYLFNMLPEVVVYMISNEVVSFLISGLLPLLMFELAAAIAVKTLNRQSMDGLNIKYGMKIFLGVGNALYGLLSLFYFAFPPLFVFGDTLLKLVLCSAFVALFVVVMHSAYAERQQLPNFISGVLGTYLLLSFFLLAYFIMSSGL